MKSLRACRRVIFARPKTWRTRRRKLKKRAVRAIWWGVAAAALASLATAVALEPAGRLGAGGRAGNARGAVMLVAAAVLFYVSYWLVSQFEAKRWTDFLREQARRGLELGGQGTLALTAFLAVYREGAETSLLVPGPAGQRGTDACRALGPGRRGWCSAWSSWR